MSKKINDLIALIKQIKFFSALPDEKIKELIPHFKEVNLKADEVLIYQNDDSLFLYILIEGKLISELSTATHERIVVGTINPVETIGELGALSGEPHSLTVKAGVDSTILKLPSKVFKDFCYEYPTILTEISKLIVDRSLQIIKLMAREERRQLLIVFPILQTSLVDKIEKKFKEFCPHYNILFLPNAKKTQIEEAIKSSERKIIAVFMKSWDSELFKFLIDELARFYILVESERYSDFTPETKKILDNIKHIPNVRLELILLHPENIQRPKNTKKWLEKANFNLHHHVQMSRDETWHRLLRFMTGKATALVLGGGGAKGLSHLGVIKAMEEKNIPIDAVGGASIGSVISACYAIGQNYEKTMELFDKFKGAAKKSISFKNLTWPFISLFSANPITKIITSVFGSFQIEDLWIPYFAVSSNLVDRSEFNHKTGFLWEAIRSSASLPGVFPPVIKEGKLLFDGGIINNLPVDVMREMIGGDHKIIASQLSTQEIQNMNYDFPMVLTLKDALLFRFRLGRRKYVFPSFLQTFVEALLLGGRRRLRRNCLAADVLVSPDLSKFKSLAVTEEESQQLMNLGYKSALAALEKAEKNVIRSD